MAEKYKVGDGAFPLHTLPAPTHVEHPEGQMRLIHPLPRSGAGTEQVSLSTGCIASLLCALHAGKEAWLLFSR